MEQITSRFMNWASILEENTKEQALRTSSMPFVYPHLALMPDAHLGKGATVGSVIPTLGAIMPAAVGVDIGCGMIAVRTQFTLDDLTDDTFSAPLMDSRGWLRGAIQDAIPLSAGNYNTQITESAYERIDILATHADAAKFDPSDRTPNWQFQLGTLGSGNHFIEVSLDEEDRVWLFLHSGSRGVGNKIAVDHIRIAQEYDKRHWIELPDPDLAYLVEGTDEFDRYIRELRWAQHFALLNREEMMDRVISAFERWIGAEIEESERINCHHNYTEKEVHFGKEVYLSRKGAINASLGMPGLVPGSMGTRSYVVEGLGNKLALNSSPHGAGRNFSRSAARKTFSMAELEENMRGIEWSHSSAFLDEIPAAYKDIDIVMEDAKDLVSIKHTLRQIINVKGD